MRNNLKVYVGGYAMGKTNELVKQSVELAKSGERVLLVLNDTRKSDALRRVITSFYNIPIKSMPDSFSKDEIALAFDFIKQHITIITGEKIDEIESKFGGKYKLLFDFHQRMSSVDTVLFDDIEWLAYDDERNITPSNLMECMEVFETILKDGTKVYTTMQRDSYKKAKDLLPEGVEIIQI